MNFNKKDVVVGLILLLVLVGGFYLYNKKQKSKTALPTPTPVSVSYRKNFENNFKLDIPDNVNAFELKDVSGGDGQGIATDKEILADIKDPESDYFYQGWLEKDGKLVSIGKLVESKGGWMLEYDSSFLEGADKVIVSLEKTYDSTIEKRILEGPLK